MTVKDTLKIIYMEKVMKQSGKKICASHNVHTGAININTNLNEDPMRRNFIEKLGQALAKPAIICWLEQKPLPKQQREMGYI